MRTDSRYFALGFGDRVPRRLGSVVLDTQVLIELHHIYRPGLGALFANRSSRSEASRLTSFLREFHLFGEISPTFAGVERSWDSSRGALDEGRYRSTVGVVAHLASLPDALLRRVLLAGEPLAEITGSPPDVDEVPQQYAGVLLDRLVPTYCILRETWRSLASHRDPSRQLEDVADFINEELQLLSGHAALIAALLCCGTDEVRASLRRFLKFPPRPEGSVTRAVARKLRAASWDVFFAHLVEAMSVRSSEHSFAGPHAVLTADKAFVEYRLLTRFGGLTGDGCGLQQFDYDSFMPGHQRFVEQWLNGLNGRYVERAERGHSLQNEEWASAMKSRMREYLDRTHDGTWGSLFQS